MSLESVMDISPRINETGQKRIFHQLSTMYKNPEEALREYITNAVDSIQNKGEITAVIDHYSRTIIIEDNGPGMSYQKLSKLPIEVGDSEKYGRIDQRGEKAVGILAFGTLGNRLQIVSRENGPINAPHNILEYWFDGRNNTKELKARVSNTRSEKTIEELGGPIKHGTRAIINLSEDVYKRDISLETLEKTISSIYAPLIRNGRINFFVGEIHDNNGKTRELKKISPQETENKILENRTIVYEAKKRGIIESFPLEVFLSFNPESDQERVALHSKDVLVYDSILKLDREIRDLRLFTCGNINGYINEPNLKLTLGRDAISSDTRNSNAYKGLIHQLKELDTKHWPLIEKIIIEKIKNEERGVFSEALNELQEIYKIIGEPLDIIRRKRMPSEEDETGIRKKGNEGDRKNNSRTLPFKVMGRDFDIHERDIRSTLGEDILGNSLIEINTSHPDYMTVIREGNQEQQIHYIFRLAIPRIVQGEAESAINEGKISAQEAPIKIATRIEELSFAALPTTKKSRKRLKK